MYICITIGVWLIFFRIHKMKTNLKVLFIASWLIASASFAGTTWHITLQNGSGSPIKINGSPAAGGSAMCWRSVYSKKPDKREETQVPTKLVTDKPEQLDGVIKLASTQSNGKWAEVGINTEEYNPIGNQLGALGAMVSVVALEDTCSLVGEPKFRDRSFRVGKYIVGLHSNDGGYRIVTARPEDAGQWDERNRQWIIAYKSMSDDVYITMAYRGDQKPMDLDVHRVD
jgi:hypothetical protein